MLGRKCQLSVRNRPTIQTNAKACIDLRNPFVDCIAETRVIKLQYFKIRS